MTFKAVVTAFQFLTIIPLRTDWEISEKDVGDATVFFPLVGAFQGIVLALLAFLFLKGLSPAIAAGFVLLAYLLTNGGFHYDGLSDTIDAFSVKSSGDKTRDRAKRLSVMKDSTIGPMGVLAIVFSLGLKYLLLKELLAQPSSAIGLTVLFLMPVFSKLAMVFAIFKSKSARTDGIGIVLISRMKPRHFLFSSLIALAILLCASATLRFMPLFPMGCAGDRLLLFLCLGAASTCFFALALRKVFTVRFGGMTGDTFGAIHEISEIPFLLIALLWL